jgi:hypothetical protein
MKDFHFVISKSDLVFPMRLPLTLVKFCPVIVQIENQKRIGQEHYFCYVISACINKAYFQNSFVFNELTELFVISN